MIAGLVIGALTRLLPEVVGFFTKKADNAQELALGKQQIELAQLKGQLQAASDTLTADSADFKAATDALKSAYATVHTGVSWVDGLNGLIRPYYVVIFVHAWLAFKAATMHQLLTHGIAWDVAVVSLWSDGDQELFAAIANFFFLGRVFDKTAGKAV